MRNLYKLFAAALTVTAMAPAFSEPMHTPSAMPSWLLAQTQRYESLGVTAAPIGIWRISHRGKTAFFVEMPCCDQFNPLFDVKGKVICNPSGGIHGIGDGRCPYPADPKQPIELLWVHPQAVEKNPSPLLRSRQ